MLSGPLLGGRASNELQTGSCHKLSKRAKITQERRSWSACGQRNLSLMPNLKSLILKTSPTFRRSNGSSMETEETHEVQIDR